MSRRAAAIRIAAIRGRLRREDGQVLPFITLGIVLLLLCAGLVIDVGRTLVAQQQLQAAVDGAALVAGQDLPNASTAYSAALSYAGAKGDKNQLSDGITASAPTVTFECLSHAPNYTSGSPPTCPKDTSSNSCQPTGAATPQPTGATTCNAVKVASPPLP